MLDWVCVAVCRYENGQEINKTVLDTMMTFSRKQKGGVIDVWWMYDDGGETLHAKHIQRKLFTTGC